jgi:Protein of unknown function (DUF3024)
MAGRGHRTGVTRPRRTVVRCCLRPTSPGSAGGSRTATDDSRSEPKVLIRYELDVADRHVTLYECRPPWRPEYGPEWTRFPIVRFHYTKARREWATYWRDRNLRFHRFEPQARSRRIEGLLEAVDVDTTGIFWG